MNTQHIPYHLRAQDTLYIGFEKPRRTNGWGIAGFTVSLLGIPTLGILSPVGLFLSLIGMLRGPRKLATAGTVLGMIGTGFWVMLFYAILSADDIERRHAEFRRDRQATVETIEEVNNNVNQFIIQNEGELPDEIEGNRFAVQYRDAWGLELQYEAAADGFLIISAGPDQKFNTRDDVTKKYSYEVKKSDQQYLVEL